MSVAYEAKDIKTISWGSIIAGVVTVMAVSILLSTLGSSLGFAMVEPKSDDPVNGVGMAVGLWTLSLVYSWIVYRWSTGVLRWRDSRFFKLGQCVIGCFSIGCHAGEFFNKNSWKCARSNHICHRFDDFQRWRSSGQRTFSRGECRAELV